MKRVLPIAAMFVASVLLWPESAHAQNCSAASLKGRYGYTEVGAPWNVVGVLTFDGSGNVVNDFTIVFSDGTISQGNESWTYEVGADCRFTLTNRSAQQYFGALVLNRSELRWVIGVDGFVAKGEAHQLRL